MTLLDFARGPALEWSLIIMVAGILLRLLGALLLRRKKILSKPRSNATVRAGLRTIINRSWAAPVWVKPTLQTHITGYVMHIGILVALFLFIPHIELISSVTGLSWPGLPNQIVTIASALAIGVLIFSLFRRMTNPVLRTISNADDYITWLMVTLPLVTGMMAFAHLGPRYETMLALHMLSAELMFIWLPFGKLMHMFTAIPSRAQEGAKFERRGVKA